MQELAWRRGMAIIVNTISHDAMTSLDGGRFGISLSQPAAIKREQKQPTLCRKPRRQQHGDESFSELEPAYYDSRKSILPLRHHTVSRRESELHVESRSRR